MQPQAAQRMALVGMDDGSRGEGKFRVRYHGKMMKNIRPHHVFANWARIFKLPWICFIEIALFCTYFLFAFFHQRGAVAFSLDFSESISSFFTKDIKLVPPPLGIESGVGQIYFEEDLLSILNITMSRVFLFPTSFPCAYPIIPNQDCKFVITFINGSSLEQKFTKKTAEETAMITKNYFHEMDSIVILMNYHIQVNSQNSDTRMNIEVTADFKRNYDTDTIIMDISHTRFHEVFALSTVATFLETFDFSLPIFIGCLNIIVLILTAVNTNSLYIYCKAKANDSGERPIDVFWAKFDKWSIFSAFTHLVSIAASIMYIIVGQDIEEDIPPIVFMMTAASFLHAMLLVRYLQLKPSTMLIIMVFYNSLVKILQFLIGCLPVFLGVLCFSECIFGFFSENFASGMQGAAFLFCTMHGDSLKGFFNTMMLQYDVNYYFGFFTAAFWILFSLTIIFNITISIVQEMMAIEEYKVAHAGDEGEKLPVFNILSDELALLSAKRSL